MAKTIKVQIVIIGLILLLPAGCSDHTDSVSKPENPTESYAKIGNFDLPGATGQLEGQVLLESSEIPPVTQVENTTDPEYCGKIQSLQDLIVSPESRGIKNVIVALADVSLPGDYRPEPDHLVLDNRNCQFEPHVAVLTTGSIIEARNSDSVFHSVHLYGFRNINVGLGPNAAKVVSDIARPGYIIVKCDVHGWMKSFIRVDTHPFHTVTDSNGRFRIEDIPPGSYTLELWHERLGPKTMEATVRPKAASRQVIRYTQ